jgi:uncharacterized protein DUF87
MPGTNTVEDTRHFLGRLRRTLRAAHGLGLRLNLRWSSGPSGGAVIGVPPVVGDRWVHFGLSSAYELGQWRAMENGPTLSMDRPAYVVSSAGRIELPFPAPFDEPPWSESVLIELAGLRTGVAVEWELMPDPAVPTNAVEVLPTTDPTAGEFRFRTTPERGVKDRQEARRTGLRWQVSGRILLSTRLADREACARVAHLLEVSSHMDGGNGFVCRPVRPLLSRLRLDPVLSEAELVGLFPPPCSMALSPLRPHQFPPARLWLGRDLKGSSVGLPVEPAEGRHLLILGETGMGKSSIVTRLAWQAARWGSVILFDPVGDTALGFLAGLPDSCASRISWVSPSRSELSLNLLAEVASSHTKNPAREDRIISDVVAALRRVRAGRYTESAFWGPRLEEMLFQAIRAASRWPGASLTVAERLLTPEGMADRSVPESARDAVRAVRRRIEHNPQDGDGARRLLSEITRNGVLGEMLDAPSPTWSIEACVAPGRVTVVSGEAPRVGESVARYLLAVLLALTWNGVLARESSSKTFVILDEAQWYAHDSVAEMLRLGRRFNLHLWAVTQSLGSLPEGVRDALMTNSADVVLFRGDPSDARDISRWVPYIVPERIMRMPRGEAAVLLDKGAELHWVQLSPPSGGRGDAYRFTQLPPVDDRSEVYAESEQAAEEALERDIPELPGFPSQDTPSVLEAIRQMMPRGEFTPELRVHLADLRARGNSDPAVADRWVRNAGRYLASAGALVRKGKDDTGSYWILSRQRLLNLLPPELPLVGATRGTDLPSTGTTG